ncbi:unnamed protein product [Parnassius apollo]|uniref:(apollo) hypothetical protein n=1 Tax=Parnassius apollo TaxID=110799 RepID=A0A8S3Y9L8_PARAO|nr:unnamed protein product [Parnassius apollo]
MCKQVFLINSEDHNDKEQVNLNIAATTGIVASGIGFSQFEELCSAMDIPVFSSKYYSKLEDGKRRQVLPWKLQLKWRRISLSQKVELRTAFL